MFKFLTFKNFFKKEKTLTEQWEDAEKKAESLDSIVQELGGEKITLTK